VTAPVTSCEVVVFCSSSGHCQLDCDYCIVHPVIKRQPSITYEDLHFFLDTIKKSTYFIFSGKGDFFAGYPKRDRFLDRLLDHEVEVALDINGVLLNEYAELSAEKLEKIRAMNLTLHWKQVRDKRVEKVWAENARTILERHRGEILVGTILAPAVSDSWEEGLAFYEKEIFRPTGRKIWLIEDCERPYSESETEQVALIREKWSHLVDRVHHEDFAASFAGREDVLCPAGQEYFRIWHDGRVQGCPYIGELQDLGNLKEKRFIPRLCRMRCNTPKFCDCFDILSLGKMKFPEEASSTPDEASRVLEEAPRSLIWE
jgi:MoaA/NifB/PqqE/SkfB family radical SAM enzyme